MLTWPALKSVVVRAPRWTVPTRNSPKYQITSPSTRLNCESHFISIQEEPRLSLDLLLSVIAFSSVVLFVSDHLFSVPRRLNNNEFTVLEATGIFKKLPHLRKM